MTAHPWNLELLACLQCAIDVGDLMPLEAQAVYLIKAIP